MCLRRQIGESQTVFEPSNRAGAGGLRHKGDRCTNFSGESEKVNTMIRREYKCGKTTGKLKENRYTVYYSRTVKEFDGYAALPATVQKFLSTHYSQQPESHLYFGDQIWFYRYYEECAL